MTGKTNHSFSPLALTPLLLALSLAGLCSQTMAQDKFNAAPADAPAPAAAAAPAAQRPPANITLLPNGIAPKLKSNGKRTSVKSKEAYRPIEKQDDAGQVPEIELFAGESRVFPTPGVARIAVGNGGVLTAAVLDDKETIIFGNAAGTSSLFIWNADGRYQRLKVNVVPGDTSRIAREIAAFLSGIPNTKASIVGDKVIVEGAELSDADRDKIVELSRRYPQIVNFTSAVGWEKMVLLDVKVVEFPKTELRELGLKWSATGGAAAGAIWSPLSRGNIDGKIVISTTTQQPIQPLAGKTDMALPSALSALTAVNMGLNAQLNLLEQDGKATMLAEPQLSARSGSKATFLAGGEIPYAVASLLGTTIEFKQYGIKLEIVPKVGLNGIVRATIEAEVSDIDRTTPGGAGGPALLTRRTNTEFNVRTGETIVLSGLLQHNTGNDIDKVPFLGNIPVLGTLFRSKRFQSRETELVVFVTPSVVDSQTPGLVDRVQRTNERLRERLGPSPYLSEPLQPGSDAAHPDQHGSDPSEDPAAPLPSAGAPVPAPVAPAVPQPVAVAGNTLRVTRDGLAIRAAADPRSQVLFELGYNSVVRAGSMPNKTVNGVQWRNVSAGDINGWVLADQVEPVGTKPLTASTQGALARQDQTGKPLTLGTKSAGVAPAAPATVTTTAAPASETRYRVILNNLALHVSPDTNALVVQKLAEGSVVQTLPQAARGTWIAVQAGEARGWVPVQWLRPLTEGQ